MLETYTVEGTSGSFRNMDAATASFHINADVVRTTLTSILNATGAMPTPEAPRPRLRTLSRRGYHSAPRDYASALDRIVNDEDGVKRSFGLEWEINGMSEQDEHDLAVMLDTMPAHVCENDSSLHGNRSVELVFMPMGRAAYIDTFTKLQTFCSRTSVSMQGTGAHTTYGVSNSTSDRNDIQIRLNRAALAIASITGYRAMQNLFGRHFTSYASLPGTDSGYGGGSNNPVLANNHRNAFSINGRPGNSMWECRLMSHKGDCTRLADMFKALEFVFHTHMTPVHFGKIFEFMGADASGQ